MKTAVTLIFIFLTLGVFAQEPLMPELPEQDSMQLQVERDVMYRQFLSGISPLGELMKPIEMPEFSFNEAISPQWNYDLSTNSFNNWLFPGFHTGHYRFSPAPFLRNGAIFSQGSYHLNDKFKVGGYSFGGNSIFSAPFPNQNTNNFDFRGSTLFMEYKVSDKFKIETRVSVTQGR